VRVLGALLLYVSITLLLRSTALTALAARGVVIDVLAVATAVWALRYREVWGTGFGFALGLAADLDAAHWVGRHALLLSLAGYGVGRLSQVLVRDSVRTHLAVFFLVTLVHQTWSAAFEFGGVGAWPLLAERVLLASVATAPIGALFLYLVRRVSGQSLFGHAALSSGSQS
jgi:rod shape-determining protein MreD